MKYTPFSNDDFDIIISLSVQCHTSSFMTLPRISETITEMFALFLYVDLSTIRSSSLVMIIFCAAGEASSTLTNLSVTKEIRVSFAGFPALSSMLLTLNLYLVSYSRGLFGINVTESPS